MAALLPVLVGFGVVLLAARAGAAGSAGAHYYAADRSPRDAYGTADAVWSGPPTYGGGHTGQPEDSAFVVGADRWLALSDPDVGNYGTQDFTVHLWVKLTGDAARRYEIVSKRSVCGYVSFFDLRAFGAGELYAEVQDANNGQFHVTVPVNVLDDAWHQITVTRSGTTFSIIADGVTGSGVTNGIVNFDSTAPWSFGDGACVDHGSGTGDGTLRAIGRIDDVSFGPGTAVIEPPPAPSSPTASPVQTAAPAAASTSMAAPVLVPTSGRATTARVVRPPSGSAVGSPNASTAASPLSTGSPSPARTSKTPAAAAGTSAAIVPPAEPSPPVPVSTSLTPEGAARLDAAVRAHRVSLVPLSVRTPETVATDGKTVGENVLIALVALVAIGFSAQIANKAYIENYDEIMAFASRARNGVQRAAVHVRGIRGSAALAVFGLVSAGIHGLVDPGFGLDRASLALALGLSVAFLVVTCAWELPLAWSLHNRTTERRAMRIFVGSIPIAILCVLITRVGHIKPGYLLGVCAAVETTEGRASDAERGRGVFLCAVFTVGAAVTAWCWSVPVDRAVTHALQDHGNAPFVLLALQAALSCTVVAGLECAVFGLLPMTFVKGAQVLAWSRRWWAVVMGVAIFGLLHLVLHPVAGTEGSLRADISTWLPLPVVVLTSLLFWAYFRKRVRDRERVQTLSDTVPGAVADRPAG